MSNVMSNDGLDLISAKARTHNAWLDRPVEDRTAAAGLRPGEDGADSANMCPLRIVFAKHRRRRNG